MHVLVTAWRFPRLDAARLALAPDLRFVMHAASSLHWLVSDDFWATGLPVSQAGAAMAPAVAELSLGFTLSLLRRTHRHDHALHSGQSWETAIGTERPREISGARIGVVGASRTGRRYIDMCRALGADVRVHDPYVRPDDPLATLTTGLRDLLATSDVVALHAPATPETHGMIGADEIAAMRDGTRFVNTSRPSLVDMDALFDAVASGRIDAALDVFDSEPLPVDDRWRGLPNVLLTPHIAGATADSRQRAGRIVVEEIHAASGRRAPGARAHARRPGEQGMTMTTARNILLLHCHDLGRFLGAYKVPTVVSPHLDALAAQSTLFEAAFATAPHCSPARASLFTGTYPQTNGVLGLTHDPFGWDLTDPATHLAGLLGAAGYTTELIGVHHESRVLPDDVVAERLGFDRVRSGGDRDVVVERTVEALDRAAAVDAPFYLQVGFHEPHRTPSRNDRPGVMGFLGDTVTADDSLGITVPPYLRDDEGAREEIAELQGAVRHMDEGVGSILSHLDALGLSDDTIVVFTTDHGLALPRAKCTLYDPGLEVALMMRVPGLA